LTENDKDSQTMISDDKWKQKNMLNYDISDLQSTVTTLVFCHELFHSHFTSISYTENQLDDFLMKKKINHKEQKK
jgi:hypothetical protein